MVRHAWTIAYLRDSRGFMALSRTNQLVTNVEVRAHSLQNVQAHECR